MKQVPYTCEVCGQQYQAGKEHNEPKHCKICAEWMRAMGAGPRQQGKKDYRRLGLVIAHFIKGGKFGEGNFVGNFVEGIRR